MVAQDYGHARYAQFRNYIATVPRDQKLEQAGTLISEQLLNLTASLLTGKAVSVISDSVIAVQLHQAIKFKNKADKVKSKQINWLNKFGVPGKDVAQTLGLAVTEEYELAELNGLVTSFKNSPTNNQILFNHAEDYFKHNKSGKKTKSKSKSVINSAPGNTAVKKELLNEVNQSPVAIFKDGYYEVNGFKFTEYYYNRAWETGRGSPSLAAKTILDNNPIIIPDRRSGFFRYELDNWEMIYNPTTKEIHHIQPNYKSKR